MVDALNAEYSLRTLGIWRLGRFVLVVISLYPNYSVVPMGSSLTPFSRVAQERSLHVFVGARPLVSLRDS